MIVQVNAWCLSRVVYTEKGELKLYRLLSSC